MVVSSPPVPPVDLDRWQPTLRAMAGHLPDVTFLVSDATHWHACIGPWLGRRGLTSCDVVGRPLGTFVPHLVDTLAALADRALAGQHVEHEIEVRYPDGRPASWRIQAGPFPDELGRRWVLWTAEDVRPRQEFDAGRAAELDAGLARFRAALEGAPAGLVLVDADDGSFRVTELNAQMSRLLGIAPDTDLGADVATAVAAGTCGPEPLDLLASALASGAGGTSRSWVPHASGARVPVQVSCSAPIRWTGADGRPRVQLVLTFEDRTAARRGEDAARDALVTEQLAAQRLRELDRLRADFVAAISHELRTPLTAVLGNVEVLLDGDLGPLAPDQGELLATVAQQGKRLERLIETLLHSVHVERPGRHGLSGRLLDVRSVVDATRVAHAHQLARRAQTLRVHLPVGGPVVVRAVRESLRDAVSELVGNASTVSPAGTTIDLSCVVADGEVTLTVTDEGPGIDDGDLEPVFERFHRTARAAHEAWPGTGVGLWLVAQTARASGGRAVAARAPGGGAAVSITLPLCASPIGPAPSLQDAHLTDT